MTHRVAAVDCGTNSLRLLLADVDPGRAELTDVARRMEIVRLGQGVDRTGRLAPEALARTIAVLRDYADIIARSGAQAVRMVATSATRDADNAADFVRLVKEVLGVAPEVLLDQADEIGRVIGVSGGARRHHTHGLRTRTGDDVRVVAQHGDGPRERLRRQPPGLVYPLTEPDDLHPAGHVGQFGAARIYVRQQQPQRIGPTVNGSYPALHQAPPTTHGPASHHSPTASSASWPNGFTPPAASS